MYIFLKIVSHIAIFFTTRCIVTGKKNIPGQGPLLVVANHLSVADPVLIGTKLGRRVVFMAKEELFKNRFTGYIVRQYGAFPVHRNSSSREAITKAEMIIKRGQVLAMFPEGKRSKNQSLNLAFPGSALIAYNNRVRILPLGIAGSEKIRGFKWIWQRPKIQIVIGDSFYLPEINDKLRKQELAELTDNIMKHIAELLPEKYQGVYPVNKKDH